MSMMINHNFSAQLALGELNKNVSQVGSMLAKVSSGQKVTGAKDDASAYSISEKMREKIRSLMQDSQNVQNGASLIKVASGGVERIIDELRSLKELSRYYSEGNKSASRRHKRYSHNYKFQRQISFGRDLWL